MPAYLVEHQAGPIAVLNGGGVDDDGKRRSGFRVRIAVWLVSPSRWSCAPASTAAMDKTRWAETGALAHQRVIRFPREALGSASETGQAAKRCRLKSGIGRSAAQARARP